MSLSETVGHNIVFMRKRIGVTQEWLALDSEVALSYLRSIEHGEANPSIDLLSRIAFSLQIPIEVLLLKDIDREYENIINHRPTTARTFTETEVLFLHHLLSSTLCDHCKDLVEEERQKLKQKAETPLLFTNYMGR